MKTKNRSLASLAAALCVLPLVCGAQSEEDVDASTDTTHDGLVQVDKAKFAGVWVKPGVDTERYTKILPVGVDFHYRDVPEAPRTSVGRATSATQEFPIEEQNRARIEEIMAEVFLEELGKTDNFTITDEPGRDVVLVIGGLYDVVSNVPPDYIARSNNIYLSRVGEATLVLQLEDSTSREVLARVVERRGADPAFAQVSNRVTNTAEVRRLARMWARTLRNGLDTWHDSAGSVN